MNRQISGVCGGIAAYFAIDPVIIRISAVLLLLIAPPITLTAYLALALLLPWDNLEAANEPLRHGHPWQFAIYSILLLIVVPLLLSKFLLPQIIEIAQNLGSTHLPRITQFAVDMYLGSTASTILLSLILVAFATLIYVICHNRRLRRVYTICFFLLCALWAILLIVESYSFLWSFSQPIR